MNKHNPLRRFAPSTFSRIAMQFGKGDTASAHKRSAASAAWRPLRGGRWHRLRAFKGQLSKLGPNYMPDKPILL